jgi:hypothetical protein
MPWLQSQSFVCTGIIHLLLFNAMCLGLRHERHTNTQQISMGANNIPPTADTPTRPGYRRIASHSVAYSLNRLHNVHSV